MLAEKAHTESDWPKQGDVKEACMLSYPLPGRQFDSESS